MIIENPCYHCYTGAVGDIYCIRCKYRKESWSCDLESELIEITDTPHNEQFCCVCADMRGGQDNDKAN